MCNNCDSIFLMTKHCFIMWSTILYANPVSRTSSWIVGRRSLFSDAARAQFFYTDTRVNCSTRVCYILTSLIEGFLSCQHSVRQCRFPSSLLKTLMTLSCCTAFSTFKLYPSPLFLFLKRNDNTTLYRQLTRGSVLVSAHARDAERESIFVLR